MTQPSREELLARLQACIEMRIYDVGLSAFEKHMIIDALRSSAQALPSTSEPVAWQARDKVHAGVWHNVPRPHGNPNFEYRPLYPDGVLRQALEEIANRASNLADDDAAEWMPSIYSIALKALGDDPTPFLKATGFDGEPKTWPTRARRAQDAPVSSTHSNGAEKTDGSQS